MAIADAAAAAATPGGVRLIDANSPELSGLSWAPDAELGLDSSGDWALGRRGEVQVMRRAGQRQLAVPTPAAGSVQVLDGAATAELLPADAPTQLVLVCRASVPSLRAAEARLTALAVDAPLLAVLGPARWPAVLTAALGPAVNHLRDRGRVVAVPVDKQLELTGVTSRPLPRAVAQAGNQLLHACTTSPQPPAAGSPEEGNQG